MSNLKKARMIIVRKTRYGESDLIIQGLDSSGGKISCMARAALKSKKRFGGGVLEPLHFVEIQYREKPQGQLNVLEEASVIEDFKEIRKDYDKLEVAFFFLGVVSKISQEGDNLSEGVFNLLGHALRTLELVRDPQPLRLVFSLKLLFSQGVLEVEDWMRPILKQPLLKWDETLPVDRKYEAWVSQVLERYLSTAGTH